MTRDDPCIAFVWMRLGSGTCTVPATIVDPAKEFGGVQVVVNLLGLVRGRWCCHCLMLEVTGILWWMMARVSMYEVIDVRQYWYQMPLLFRVGERWWPARTTSLHQINTTHCTICVQRSKEERKLFGSSASQCAFRSTKSQVRCYLSCCRQRWLDFH